MRPALATVLFVAWSLSACGDDAGLELTVDLRTDLRGGLEFDELVVELESVRGEARETLRGPDSLGAFVTDDYVSGRRVAEFDGLAAGTYSVRVSLTLEGALVASRIVEQSITTDSGIIVLMTRSCASVVCAAGETCVGGSCVAPTCEGLDVPGCGPEQCRLDEHCSPQALCAGIECRQGVCFHGPDDNACPPGYVCHAERGCVVASSDAAVPADACVPAAETCNRADDDCDGAVDEDFDLETDPQHCGDCGNACAAAGGLATCVGGACGISCRAGGGDCDSDSTNGCETDLTTATSCGMCGAACDAATPVCAPGVAGFSCAGTCPPEAPTACGTSCVDTVTSPLHCGSCGRPCEPINATGRCETGTCNVASCDAGHGDCNGDAADGCETSLATVSDCGACGATCSRPRGVTSCPGGTCQLVACDPGWADCNGVASDGCETDLSSDGNCGGCGVSCGATESCASGTCMTSVCLRSTSAWGPCSETGDDAQASCGAFRIFCDGDCFCIGPGMTIECDVGGIADECADVSEAIRDRCCTP